MLFNILFRFINYNLLLFFNNYLKLDIFFIIILININKNFYNKLFKSY